jgi:murein DD-endopeptidase MepM/ murein hydrolase activator NlpD
MLFAAAIILSGVVCGSLAYPVLAPDDGQPPGDGPTAALETSPTVIVQEDVTPEPEASFTPTFSLPTEARIVPPSQDKQILYYASSGDSLPVVSLRFGVDMDEITSPDDIDTAGLLPPGQLLIIPNRLSETSSPIKLLPDSEVIFSPSTLDFDIAGFVAEAGGYLSQYSEYLTSTGHTSGADIIARVALEYAINPRLLLAALEAQSGWVYGQPLNAADVDYPLGWVDPRYKGLFLQCTWFASQVLDGYYGWREGRLLVLEFADGRTLRLAPQLNAGTVGIMNVYSRYYGFEDWAYTLYGQAGFLTLFEAMFGSPWLRAQGVEPLIPANTLQPEIILPFEINRRWAFTGGPHAAWGVADVWAALDFAPGSALPGCQDSNAWVVASIPGLIVRSENGVVVIDMDGDGFEQTGWTLLYLHIATEDRIPAGTRVSVGDRIGHPSCEGGRATGTHVHLARRYNGEWVPADGPVPFVLSGWQAKAGVNEYEGWLIRDEAIIYANTASTYEAQLIREE